MLRLLLPLLVAALVIVAIGLAMRGRSAAGFERIVRCRAGHLFTTTIIPGASLKAVRLGKVRFQRCPVGHHWTLVAPVDEAALSSDEIAEARARHDIHMP